METFYNILREHYQVTAASIHELPKGWSARVFHITAQDQDYLLKVYDKNLSSTAWCTKRIDDYMPIVRWLNENTPLSGRMIDYRQTVDGRWRCEDSSYIYMVFPFIPGDVIGEDTLNVRQQKELGELIGLLHTSPTDTLNIPRQLTEQFQIPFCTHLQQLILSDFADCPDNAVQILKNWQPLLLDTILETETLAVRLLESPPAFVLCHTDVHGFNLVQSDHLALIDWEGLLYAPAEADLFNFADTKYWASFWSAYQSIHPDYTPSPETMRFYELRRKIEDIWEFAERLMNNILPLEIIDESLFHLENECRKLSHLMNRS